MYGISPNDFWDMTINEFRYVVNAKDNYDKSYLELISQAFKVAGATLLSKKKKDYKLFPNIHKNEGHKTTKEELNDLIIKFNEEGKCD